VHDQNRDPFVHHLEVLEAVQEGGRGMLGVAGEIDGGATHDGGVLGFEPPDKVVERNVFLADVDAQTRAADTLNNLATCPADSPPASDWVIARFLGVSEHSQA
jgi:hypothetical protein